ncbi:hypothetical protein AMATHDRAFT_66246 [Amanita thiersii Skay4041]|uniref:Uncharacterized protein n=1 Tax=Amanita thiersii Skay4041 TaxID=703135 RepID=A0A2A9NBT5_9AGAR|nr:hypothetical protein AMATHDRAFT_66246 [Amanita thiersii Skay4041]
MSPSKFKLFRGAGTQSDVKPDNQHNPLRPKFFFRKQQHKSSPELPDAANSNKRSDSPLSLPSPSDSASPFSPHAPDDAPPPRVSGNNLSPKGEGDQALNEAAALLSQYREAFNDDPRIAELEERTKKLSLPQSGHGGKLIKGQRKFTFGASLSGKNDYEQFRADAVALLREIQMEINSRMAADAAPMSHPPFYHAPAAVRSSSDPLPLSHAERSPERGHHDSSQRPKHDEDRGIEHPTQRHESRRSRSKDNHDSRRHDDRRKKDRDGYKERERDKERARERDRAHDYERSPEKGERERRRAQSDTDRDRYHSHRSRRFYRDAAADDPRHGSHDRDRYKDRDWERKEREKEKERERDRERRRRRKEEEERERDAQEREMERERERRAQRREREKEKERAIDADQNLESEDKEKDTEEPKSPQEIEDVAEGNVDDGGEVEEALKHAEPEPDHRRERVREDKYKDKKRERDYYDRDTYRRYEDRYYDKHRHDRYGSVSRSLPKDYSYMDKYGSHKRSHSHTPAYAYDHDRYRSSRDDGRERTSNRRHYRDNEDHRERDKDRRYRHQRYESERERRDYNGRDEGRRHKASQLESSHEPRHGRRRSSDEETILMVPPPHWRTRHHQPAEQRNDAPRHPAPMQAPEPPVKVIPVGPPGPPTVIEYPGSIYRTSVAIPPAGNVTNGPLPPRVGKNTTHWSPEALRILEKAAKAHGDPTLIYGRQAPTSKASAIWNGAQETKFAFQGQKGSKLPAPMGHGGSHLLEVFTPQDRPGQGRPLPPVGG